MRYLVYIFFLSSIALFGQHTFSIVAVDTTTGEIGSAGATCLGSEDGARDVSVIVLGKGAINTQSFWDATNQSNATARMEAGDSPQEIMDWLVNNDVANSPGSRQYLAVDLNSGSPRSAAFSGQFCFDEFNDITGPNYAIAGNVLISNDVLMDMEIAFKSETGSLAEKLMAALQGAKRVGADSRCMDEGVSSLSAYLRVAKPTDTDASYGNLSIDLNVWVTSDVFEPIDELQNLFDQVLSTNEFGKENQFEVYPNPSNGIVKISSKQSIDSVDLFDLSGKSLVNKAIKGNINDLDFSSLEKGVYVLSVNFVDGSRITEKIIIE